MKEPELVPITFTHLHSEEHDLAGKHGQMKPVVKCAGNITTILCGISDYVEFLELSRCMHAYLHYSVDLPDDLCLDNTMVSRFVIKLFTSSSTGVIPWWIQIPARPTAASCIFSSIWWSSEVLCSTTMEKGTDV